MSTVGEKRQLTEAFKRVVQSASVYPEESRLVRQRRYEAYLAEKDDAKRAEMVQDMAIQLRKIQLNELGAAMAKVSYNTGRETLEKMADRLEASPPGITETALAQEYPRGVDLQLAAIQCRKVPLPDELKAPGTRVTPGGYHRTCTYDTLLYYAGVTGMMDSVRDAATLRAHMRRLFDERAICSYMDTGLVCYTHKDARSIIGITYGAAEAYMGCLIGQDKKERYRFCHTMAIGVRLPETKPDLATEPGDVVSTERYTRSGDFEGRLVLAEHFAVAEKMLLNNTDANWLDVVDSDRYAALKTIAPDVIDGSGNRSSGLCKLIEHPEFDGRVASDYTALLWRIFSGDVTHFDETMPRGQTRLGEIPEIGGDVPDVGQQNDYGGDEHRLELLAMEYVRLTVYTACAKEWFLHSPAAVYLVNMLMGASMNMEGAFHDRTKLTAREFRAVIDAEKPDQAVKFKKDHRMMVRSALSGESRSLANALGMALAKFARETTASVTASQNAPDMQTLIAQATLRKKKAEADIAEAAAENVLAKQKWKFPQLEQIRDNRGLLMSYIVSGGIVLLVLDAGVFQIGLSEWVFQNIGAAAAQLGMQVGGGAARGALNALGSPAVQAKIQELAGKLATVGPKTILTLGTGALQPYTSAAVGGLSTAASSVAAAVGYLAPTDVFNSAVSAADSAYKRAVDVFDSARMFGASLAGTDTLASDTADLTQMGWVAQRSQQAVAVPPPPSNPADVREMFASPERFAQWLRANANEQGELATEKVLALSINRLTRSDVLEMRQRASRAGIEITASANEGFDARIDAACDMAMRFARM